MWESPMWTNLPTILTAIGALIGSFVALIGAVVTIGTKLVHAFESLRTQIAKDALDAAERGQKMLLESQAFARDTAETARKVATTTAATVTAARLEVQKVATIAAQTTTQTAAQVEEVKQTLVDSQTETNGKLDKIHTLVNSSMGTALKMNAELARWKAEQRKDLPGNDADIALAEAMENAYREHQAKQAVVDQNQKDKDNEHGEAA